MYYFRCFIGALLLGLVLQQSLHFITGRQSFGAGDGLGILMSAAMALMLFAPALLDVIRGPGAARRRGAIVLTVIGAIAAFIGVGSLIAD